MENTMENKEDVDGERGGGEEQISDSFVCCVCLDLMHKPIVLTCGHISCFWCVFKSMISLDESHCPICRHPYHHFPAICQMLHFLLLKMYPVAYTRRENQTLEEEKKSGCYSPQFDADACGSQVTYLYPGGSSSCSIITSESNSCSTSLSSSSIETSAHEQSESASHEHDKDTVHCDHTSDGTTVAVVTLGPSVKGKDFPQSKQRGQQKISVADLMCTACKQLLFNPIVLNCGHVYCESCIISSADKMLRCQFCQAPHPRGCPKVCLELVHFLEEQFPEEYAHQRDAVQLRQINVQPEHPSSRSLDKGREGENVACRSDPRSTVHVGYGCDFCGMKPIIGDRYKCKDCKEKMGFDLCSNCYSSRLKLPGRFNQQHTAEHKFELIQANLSLGSGQLVEGSIDHIYLGNSEFIYEQPSLFGDGEDDQDSLGAPHQNI